MSAGMAIMAFLIGVLVGEAVGKAERWKCSECGGLNLEDTYFCPNCGADMRGEQG